MIIYNPHNNKLLPDRIIQADKILSLIPAKYCFITGSFLYKEKYKDIDVFVVSRSKKKISLDNPKIKIIYIDFNDLYSLFYHSISKSCIAKNILPQRPLKVTLSDYWSIINEAVPTLLNQKNKYHKDVRFLVLYTEYFKSGEVLDTFQLNEKINKFKNYKNVLNYVQKEVPLILTNRAKTSYLKRFFYTQAGHYKDVLYYDAQKFLYQLAHIIIKGDYGQY